MEKVRNTDIYRIVIPVKADNIVFNSGITNEEIKNGTQGYQTSDLAFDENLNAGQIYKIDISQEGINS